MGNASMIDLFIILIVSWLMLFGYVKGGTRTLIYVSVLVGFINVVMDVYPWLRLLGFDSTISADYLHWLNRVLQPLAPVTGTRAHPVLSALAPLTRTVDALLRVVYRRLAAIGYALCVLFGLLMAVRSLDTVWPHAMARRSRAAPGLMVGLLAGVYLAAFSLHVLSVTAWLTHSGILRSELFRSVLSHTWTRVLAHGIVD
ncbi:MAG: hypothetical protein ACYCVB_16800 [Bacilli bacterium]